MLPSSHIILALLNSNRDIQPFLSVLDELFFIFEEETHFSIPFPPIYEKNRKISIILHKLLGMLKSLKKAEKSKKKILSGNIGHAHLNPKNINFRLKLPLISKEKKFALFFSKIRKKDSWNLSDFNCLSPNDFAS